MMRVLPFLLALALSSSALAATPLDTCEGDPRATGHCPSWTTSFGATTVARDEAVGAVRSPDGRTLVIAGTRRSPTVDYVTTAFDLDTGARRWQMTFDGDAHMRDDARAIAMSPDGTRVFVTGHSETNTPRSTPIGENNVYESEPMTIAYDAATGVEQWRSAGLTAEGPGSAAQAIVVSPDGSRVYVTGKSAEPATLSAVVFTMALDAATGQPLWERPHTGTNRGSEAFDLALSPDGATAYVVGESNLTRDVEPPDPEGRPEVPTISDQDVMALAYDTATGTPKWQYLRDGGAEQWDFGRLVAVAPDGSVYLGGSIEAAPYDGRREHLVARLDPADGTETWASVVDVPGPTHEWLTDLVVTSDSGRVIATGTSRNVNDQRQDSGHLTFSLRTDTGAETWRHDRVATIDDGLEADRLALSPDGGTVLQSHTVEGPKGSDVLVTALDVGSGAERWARRMARGRDRAAALLAGPHGIVAVGTSVTGTGREFLARGFDHDGGPQWTVSSGLEVEAPDQPVDSVATSDGTTLLVAGWSETGENEPAGRMHTSMTLAAIDTATGERRWERTLRTGRTDSVNALAISPDDRTLFLTGSTHPHDAPQPRPVTMAFDVETGDDIWSTERGGRWDIEISADGHHVYLPEGGCSVVSLDARTGATEWSRSYSGPNGEPDGCGAIAVSADGEQLGLAGSSNQGDQELLVRIVRASDGAPVWRRTYNGAAGHDESALFVGFAPNGGTIAVAGESRDGPVTDVLTIAYDATNGTPRWAQTWAGEGGLSDHVNGLEVTMEGVYTTASLVNDVNTTKADIAVTRYHLAHGGAMWQTSYDDLFHNEIAQNAALSPDGSQLVVSGHIVGPLTIRFLTVGFDAALGDVQWAGIYDEPGASDPFQSLSVAGGKAFVLGSTWSNGGDFGVLAYPTAGTT